MPIARVGNLLAGAAKNGANVTLTWSAALAEGDVCYLFGGHHTAGGGSYGDSGGTYTEVKAPDTVGTFGFGIWRKVQGASPDSNVVGLGNAVNTDVTAYAAVAYRGGDAASPEDVAIPAFATATSTNPNPPSIDPVSDNCAIIIAAISTTADASPGTPANYATPVGGTASDSSGALQIYISDRIISGSAAEDPPTFGTWSSGYWKAITVAVQPLVNTISATLSAAGEFLAGAPSPLLFEAWWNFANNAVDATGNSNDGTLHGTTLTVDLYNFPARAFNGTSDYIDGSTSPLEP